MSAGRAPSAILTPISLVRRATENESTPNNPTAVNTSANKLNPPLSAATNRS